MQKGILSTLVSINLVQSLLAQDNEGHKKQNTHKKHERHKMHKHSKHREKLKMYIANYV